MSDNIRLLVHFVPIRRMIECEMNPSISLKQNIRELYEMLSEEEKLLYRPESSCVYEFYTHCRCDMDVSLKTQGITEGTRLLVY